MNAWIAAHLKEDNVFGPQSSGQIHVLFAQSLSLLGEKLHVSIDSHLRLCLLLLFF